MSLNEEEAYTQEMLNKDIFLISKLLARKKFKELRKFLQYSLLLSGGTTYAYILGMLFILDMIHPDPPDSKGDFYGEHYKNNVQVR